MNTQEKIATFFARGKNTFYARGSTIILAGEQPPGVMYITRGIVEQYDATAGGDKVTVNVFRAGAFLPMSWAITNTPNTFFFAAYTDVSAQLVDAMAAVTFLKSNSDVMYDLLRRVYIGTDALLHRLALAAHSPACDRLSNELLIEAYRFGTALSATENRIRITHAALAERSGLTRETVSRELHQLAKIGLIRLSRQSIDIDIKQLEEFTTREIS
ncbi:MAG TPA: Crp/Fnr family transcriptional regulator [Candidatus Saccharimonadaceae bacterium]|nr:Crp/Fnr family transcriptional regulator [Candidatus Saccharimonadaceae bacterium]